MDQPWTDHCLLRLLYGMGADHASTVLETEYYILFQKEFSRDTLTHPLILLGLLGQVLILGSVFRFHKVINITGAAMLGVIVLLILLAGAVSGNLLMIASVVPFILLYVALMLQMRKRQK